MFVVFAKHWIKFLTLFLLPIMFVVTFFGESNSKKVMFCVCMHLYRPHPVKPMSSVESHPISTPAVKEIKYRDSTSGKIQVLSC